MISVKIASIMAIAAFAAGAFSASPVPQAIAAVIATDVQCTGCVGTSDLAGNAVTAAKIKDGEVKAAEIATGAVFSSEIKDNSISAIDMNSGFISGGFKADGQDGWIPGCGGPGCSPPTTFTITNVPNARDGSAIVATVNNGHNAIDNVACSVSDVFTGGFVLDCTGVPNDQAFLDYIVINRAGIQP